MAGDILLDGDDIYGANMRAQIIRTRIGMVFQKPNPFPAMSVRQNVLAGLKLTKIRCSDQDAVNMVRSAAICRASVRIVPAGTAVTLYMLPVENGPSKLVINKQIGQPGTEYDEKLDLGRVDLKKETLSQPVDRLIRAGRVRASLTCSPTIPEATIDGKQ